MPQVTLEAQPRQQKGKGAARSLRRGGQVPAVIYGHGREPEPLTIDAGALSRALLGISAASTLVDVTVAGRAPVKALIREIQRDMIQHGSIIHLDLYEVRADEKITVKVPLHLVGTPDGVRNFGGVLDHVIRDLEILVLPGDLPSHIDLDVTTLTIGHSMYVRDVKVARAEVMMDPNLPVCTVVAPRAEEVAAPAAEATATAEPELIRKVKPEEGEEGAEVEKKAEKKG
ncbi:MAG TPA: 50S ribosomal protein L25 [Gemmatimonadales bacterium]|nr:50S ribosomal protein L25 [Gemmatimonadales bacterium]